MPQLSPLALIGIALAAMFFGYGFGLFEGRGQGYKKRKQEEASDPSLHPVIPPPPPPDNSVLKLSLDSSQRPCLDMDGRRIDTSQMSPDQRRRLIDLMVLMRPWIDASPVARPEPAVANPTRQPATQQPYAAAPAPQAAPRVSSPAPAVPPVPGNAASASEPPASTPTTMVGQIDAILQTRLAGTSLAGRGIRLVESSNGGAMVIVGLNRYPGVGDVPEPEVQAAIRAAIAEWEKKYTPG